MAKSVVRRDRRGDEVSTAAIKSVQIEAARRQALDVDHHVSRRSSSVIRSVNYIQDVINAAPGTYDDDGSFDVIERYNFYVRGRRYLFSPCSLGVFPERSRFRQWVIWCITWKRFDQFILLMIVTNSIILALADYSHVDAGGDLLASGSIRNSIVKYSDNLFTTLFSIECAMKIIAMGFVGDQGAYLMDPWNWMDFIVVIVGILALIPGIPNVSVLRVSRVLKPLRSLRTVKGMKKLVTALLQSIPDLVTVACFMFFLFFLYGVVGVELWSGALHARCRLTPYPLRLEENLTHESFHDRGELIPLKNLTWTHDTSPWNKPRICFWPIAEEEVEHTCALGGDTFRECPLGQTCGSDYDDYGNFRFTHSDPQIRKYVLESSSYNVHMSWGIVNFDNLFTASLAIFQCITRRGWADIMYMLQDAGYGWLSVVYFVTFIVVGSFFLLHVMLAVLWGNFAEASEVEEMLQPKSKRSKLRKSARSVPLHGAVLIIIQHKAFEAVRTVLILFNTITISLDKYPTDFQLEATMETINVALTLLFMLETLIKLFGLGWVAWAEDPYNRFDAIAVLFNTIESGTILIAGAETAKAKGVASFSGLRSIRILSLFKLGRHWPSLQRLTSTMARTIHDVGNFSVLFLLFVYVYALIGMQTFAYRFRFDEHGYPVDQHHSAANMPRANFDTILWAMVTVFQILTGEKWNVVMINGWRATGWPAIIYFVSLMVLGNFIVLNLFLALLLENFEESGRDEKKKEREELKLKSRVAPMSSMRSERDSRRVSATCVQDSERVDSGQLVVYMPIVAQKSQVRRESNFLNQTSRNENSDQNTKKMPKSRYSLFVFSVKNPIRKVAIALTCHSQFENISLFLIAASSLAVALDNPLSEPGSSFVTALSWTDAALTVCFLFEVVIKIIAFGFIMDDDSYLRSNWNIMDLVITGMAMFTWISHRSQWESVVKTLRPFRALRPLRVVSLNAGLKLVANSLIVSLPEILNVIVVCLLVFTVFSVIAVNNFKGKLYSCAGEVFDALAEMQQELITFPRVWSNLSFDEQLWFNSSAAHAFEEASKHGFVTSRIVCDLLGAEWKNTIPQNFDNIWRGYQTLFQMSTTEGWVYIMLAAVDSTEIDMQPIVNHRQAWTLFFIAFMLVTTFFIIQLFVGVVIENFNRMKEKLDGTFLLSSTQREWLHINDAMLSLRPMRKTRVPQNRIQRMCYNFAHDKTVDIGILICILLNTMCMALHYFGEDDVYAKMLNHTNRAFVIIFAMKTMIKITGLGRYYWKEPWNIFDFMVIVGSMSGVIYAWAGGNDISVTASTLRSLPMGRLFRIFRFSPSLRQLFNTLLVTMPSLASIGAFLLLVVFIYATMGVQLFATVKLDIEVTETANFQSISKAMLTLIRCATGERWNEIMYELAVHEDCNPNSVYDPQMCGYNNFVGCIPLDGCGSSAAYAYFYTFTLLVSYILLNIFIAVVLEGFAYEKDRMDGVLQPFHYDNFVTEWSKLDPEATGLIEWHVLPCLLVKLEHPMGFEKSFKPSSKDVQAFLDILDVPIFRGNKVLFNDVARRIGKLVMDQINEEPLEALPATLNLEQRWRNTLTSMNIRKNEQSIFRVSHFQSAIAIHSAVETYFFRDDLRIKVAKHRDKMAAINKQRRKFEGRVLEDPADEFQSGFFSESFEEDQGEEGPENIESGEFDLQNQQFEDDGPDSGVHLSQQRQPSEHEADAEMRWFEQEYGRDERHVPSTTLEHV